MTNRINKVMRLANNEKYIIMKQAVYRDENYYLANKLTDDEEDTLDEFKLFKEVEYEGKPSVLEVTDPKIFELVMKYFGVKDEEE